MSVALLLTAEELEAVVSRAIAPVLRRLDAMEKGRAPNGPLSFAEAARRLDCSARTVKRRVQAGVYQSVQVGRMTRVVLPDVTDAQRTG